MLGKNPVEEKTEYRIVTNRTHVADRYLQFKSSMRVRNFPDFWNTHEAEAWRYVPEELCHVSGYIDEETCPTSIPYGEESRFVGCFHGHEDYRIGGVTEFTRRFPDIQKYFEHFNALRNQYLKEEQAAESAGTTNL